MAFARSTGQPATASPVALSAWIGIAAAFFVAAILIHIFTFFGINPIQRMPWVMWLHLMIFPPFIAAIYFGNKVAGNNRQSVPLMWKSTPLWLRLVSGILVLYMIVIAVFHINISDDGVPVVRDGKFYLTDHGRVLRELTEQQYHQQNAYVVRGFSAWWMVFAAISLMILVGSRRLQTNREIASEALLS